jgi:D-alanyl-lipoteichoic acid acyltransferase DltB (MBOAT superfamily)
LFSGISSYLIAPIGLSYYTFRLISYVIDIYWGKYPAERSFVKFALYVSFFPQMVSGPIQQPKDFLENVSSTLVVPSERIISGLQLILFGLFKKLVVANWLSVIVDNVFNEPQSKTGFAFLIGAYAFAFQLYADFSGLSDIAIGLGRIFGINCPRNFDSPFYASNIQLFWRRWHISLTTWLSIYVFSPLTMLFRSGGVFGTTCAIMINMLAIGLWHEASWSFFAFGFLNGVYMVSSVMTLKYRDKFFMRHHRLQSVRTFVSPLITFHLVVVAFVFVRAHTLNDSWWIISHLLPNNITADGLGIRQLGMISDLAYIGVIGVLLMEFIHLSQRRPKLKQWIGALPIWIRWLGYYAMAIAIYMFGHHDVKGFIYEKF